MNGYQKMKRQLLPLIKGLPFILFTLFIGVFMARTIVKYTPNVYQSMAKIKLDDQKFGVGNNYMYKDFEMFSVENKIDAEAELLKSPLIIGLAIDSLSLYVQFSRVGQLKKLELYKDSPFKADYTIFDEKKADQLLLMHVESQDQFTLSEPDSEWTRKGRFDQTVSVKGGELTIHKNTSTIRQLRLDVLGDYEIHLFSRDGIIADISSNLDVTALDKETPILRIVYKDENPQKVADFTNALCHAYIHDYILTKSAAAKQTVTFIESKLSSISSDLHQSENHLESFKQANGVVNTLQETETGLREISKLKIELINMEMNEKAMHELERYMSNGDYFDETAINFGFGDLLMTELVKKLKVLYDERHDLLIKYTAESENVRSIDRKIGEIKRYIKEAIRQNLKEITIKRADYERVCEEESHLFDHLPTREKEQHVLERDFQMNEDVYNFLMQKKIDASILASSMISFHRIIQPAVVSKQPVSPNKTLLTFVFGLLGLIIGISFIYFRRFTRARVLSRDDVEKHSGLPFLGVVRNGSHPGDFMTLLKTIQLKQPDNCQMITFSSTLSGEGKTFVCKQLAMVYHQAGFRTAFIDFCTYSTTPDSLPLKAYDLTNKNASLVHLNVTENEIVSANEWQQLRAHFDVILIDTPATANEVSGIEAMRLADLTVFIVRANHTCLNYLSEPEMICEEYGINNMFLLMNGAHKATNYTGNYVGSRFDYKRLKRSGIIGKIQQFYQLYFQ